MMNQMKPKIIFVHPLKTGGTSLRHMLLHEYGADKIYPVPNGNDLGDYDYPVMDGAINPLEHQAMITPQIVDGYSVVMAHYDWGIVERLPDWQPITILRHPVEQLRSLYQFMCNRPHWSQFSPEQATSEGFEIWVRDETNHVYANNQTAFLSGHHVQDAEVAICNLHQVSFGLLEYFDESVRRWNQRFGWSMTVETHNTSPKSQRITISDELRDYVEQVQWKDMLLYKEALRSFDGTA